MAPFTTQEVRWFFDGKLNDHPDLKNWFETAMPIKKDPGVKAPEWKGRSDDQPDIYLLIPGSDDMGIKWREQQLQIKGRISSSRVQQFCGRHQGKIEHWVKWSYAELPQSFKALFLKNQNTIEVKKTRALRKVSLVERKQEIDATKSVERAIAIELCDIEVVEKTFCSLAFEAYPDDPSMNAEYLSVVETFLDHLKIDLSGTNSWSYPAWLNSITSAL